MEASESAAKRPQVWEKTRLSNLVRHKPSGRYYARAYAGGKEVWKSLKTAHFSVAEAKLATFLKEHREPRARQTIDPANAKMTFNDAAELYRQRLVQNVKLKSRTRDYYNEVLAALLKSWQALGETEVRRITPTACREWSAGYAKIASSTRFNNTVAVLRHVLKIAVENGVLYSNPAAELERKAVRQKVLTLPTQWQFAQIITTMRNARSRDSRDCADLAAGLAYTGCRKGEANALEWADLDFDKGSITIKGTDDNGTKNGEVRRVPMIAAARALFERMRSERDLNDKNVFGVRECQKSLDRAAKIVGAPRMRHHDVRHFFATVCIESGVDVPTVSRWLGHKDGGALAMRTYGHLRDEHSTAAAQRVTFALAA